MKVTHMIQNRCPRCGNGQVFHKSRLIFLKSTHMNSQCPSCGLKFEKEPGFYWGAMYVSYGLAVIESIIIYALSLLAGLPSGDYRILGMIFLFLILLFPFNYRTSRLTWLYIFG